MGGKVFHVDDDLHQAVKDWCSQHNLTPKEWVSEILTMALEARVVVPGAWRFALPISDETMITKPAVTRAEIVGKKKLPDPMEKTGDEPWTRPPFWKDKNKAGENEEN